MAVPVLVPFRSDDPRRVSAFEYVKGYWASHGFDVVVGNNRGRFNRSAARNSAAKRAGDWRVAVFADADTFPNRVGLVREAVAVAEAEGCWVNVAVEYGRLDERVSRRVVESDYWPARGDCGWTRGSPPPGGVIVVPRHLFDLAGGWDEGFDGWGMEDSALLRACMALGEKPRWMSGGFVFHLYHEEGDRRSKRADDPVYQENRRRFHRYDRLSSDREGMLALVAELRAAPAGKPARLDADDAQSEAVLVEPVVGAGSELGGQASSSVAAGRVEG